MQIFQQLGRSLGAGRQIPDDEHRPFVANQLQRAGNRAAINLASSQCELGLRINLEQAPKYAQLTLCASPGFEVAVERVGEEKNQPKKEQPERWDFGLLPGLSNRNFCW